MSELLCHCRMNPDGHEPGSVLDCEAPTIRPGRWLRPEIRRIGEYEHIDLAKVDARGTCPVCERNVRVIRIGVYRDFEGERRTGRMLPPVENPAKPRGTALEVRPGMAPHKVAGAQCDGVGRVPTETRYTPGRELASFLAILAEESELEEKIA